MTEVFVIAGRWDETVDYGTSIALANSYPLHQLLVADDNHLFAKLNASGLRLHLLRTFLKYGLNSPQLNEALQACEPYRWKEPGV